MPTARHEYTQEDLDAAVAAAIEGQNDKLRKKHDSLKYTEDMGEAYTVGFFEGMEEAEAHEARKVPGGLIRFCPECGKVGDVSLAVRDCCPDGSHAAYMPKKTAELCAALFRDALASAPPAPQADKIAYKEAVNLATALFNKHFAHEEHYKSGRIVWELCDTTAGVISQIDNMVSGLVQPPQASVVFCTYPSCHSAGATCTGPCATQPIQKASMVKLEPVAEITEAGENVGVVEWLVHSGRPIRVGQMLYTHPAPVREPLTPEQIIQAYSTVYPRESFGTNSIDFARAVEAAHGITKDTP